MNGQNTRLERDISKRESLAVRRRDSVADRSSKVLDPKKSKGLASSLEFTMQVMAMGIRFCSICHTSIICCLNGT